MIEHAAFSRKIAGQRLLPRPDKISGETRVVANGFPCRHQIADPGVRQPSHVAELILEFL